MLVGARLNWLLGHGRTPLWAAEARFIQVDISAEEFDSNRPIAAPLVGDIRSVMAQLVAELPAGQVAPHPSWRDELATGSSTTGRMTTNSPSGSAGPVTVCAPMCAAP